MMVKNKHQLIQTVSQETYHMCRFLESCETELQLETTRTFCDYVINRWNTYAVSLKQKEIDELTPFVESAVNNVSLAYTNTKSIIAKVNNTEKVKPENVVIKGFC